MKAKFKIFTVIILCIFLAFGFTAFAESTEPESTEFTEISEPKTDGYTEEIENPFAVIYNEALSHASEIFSLLSLIGTIIISWFYKRGLLPSVRGVLGSVSTSVIKLKENSETEFEARKAEAEKINERLNCFEDTLKGQSELICALENRLISEEDIYRQREKSNIILSSQIDLLYDIFMSSSLPQFQKEAMGDKINKMRKELKGYEKA